MPRSQRHRLLRVESAAVLRALRPPSPAWTDLPDPAGIPDEAAARHWAETLATRVAPERRARLVETATALTEPDLRLDASEGSEHLHVDGWQDTPSTLRLGVRPGGDPLAATSPGREGTGTGEHGERITVARLAGWPTPVVLETEEHDGIATLGWLLRWHLRVAVRDRGLLGRARVVEAELLGDVVTVPIEAERLLVRLRPVLAAHA
ncbi:hypothetical protein [Auraticoccus monumenti]|uniref:Uncharacterized protein n=1 Tax=Auraticoccus monumenti TaxID=675864 RepID=A0A1G6W6A8_9ACTN|nr:hypothetical protein [Auraticoccus monumenti]SDD61328.1 hypothetical protein SAMN04489747_1358 [Auraticoccus monumenti]